MNRRDAGCAALGLLVGAGCSAARPLAAIPAGAESQESQTVPGAVAVSGLRYVDFRIDLGPRPGDWRRQRVALDNPRAGYWTATVPAGIKVDATLLEKYGAVDITAERTGVFTITVNGAEGEKVTINAIVFLVS